MRPEKNNPSAMTGKTACHGEVQSATGNTRHWIAKNITSIGAITKPGTHTMSMAKKLPA